MALFAKDPQEILKEAEAFMLQNTPINSTGPGSKMYAILQIIKKHLGDAYITFDFNTAIGFVYGAKGRYLDYLGDIFGVQRLDEETDDNFRYRIVNQKLVAASANETALRIACLKVPGVADVEYFDRHYGAGTSVVMIKATTPIVSDELITRCQYELDKVKGSGMKSMAVKPDYLSMRFVVSVQFKEGTPDSERTIARQNIVTTTTDYVNNLDIAEDFNVNKLAALLTKAHPKIKSIGKPNKYFDKIFVNKVIDKSNNRTLEVEIINNYQPADHQKLIMSTESNNIVFV